MNGRDPLTEGQARKKRGRPPKMKIIAEVGSISRKRGRPSKPKPITETLPKKRGRPPRPAFIKLQTKVENHILHCTRWGKSHFKLESLEMGDLGQALLEAPLDKNVVSWRPKPNPHNAYQGSLFPHVKIKKKKRRRKKFKNIFAKRREIYIDE